MSIWHSTEAVCLILGLICIFYYIGIVGYAGITADFAWIWLMGAAFLLAIAGGMAAESRHHMAVLANLLRAAGILMAMTVKAGIPALEETLKQFWRASAVWYFPVFTL